MKIKFPAAAAVLVFTATLAYSQQQNHIEVFSPATVVDLIKERISTIQSFVGTFTYRFDNNSYYGTILYRSPDKFALEYSGAQGGNKIISDGKILWLVFKSDNIAIKEHLDTENSTPLVGWNISRLLREYVPTQPEEGFKVDYGGKAAYKLKFVPKSNTAGFRYIYMVVSTDGYILKITAQNQVGKVIELGVTYSSVNTGVAQEHFQFEPDENTQIYEDMLIPHEE